MIRRRADPLSNKISFTPIPQRFESFPNQYVPSSKPIIYTPPHHRHPWYVNILGPLYPIKIVIYITIITIVFIIIIIISVYRKK